MTDDAGEIRAACVQYPSCLEAFHLDNGYNHGYTQAMKTAISIPEKVYHSAENLAKRLGISRSQLYTAAVIEYLDRHEDQKITERLNAVYEQEESALPSDVSRLQAATLLREQW